MHTSHSWIPGTRSLTTTEITPFLCSRRATRPYSIIVWIHIGYIRKAATSSCESIASGSHLDLPTSERSQHLDPHNVSARPRSHPSSGAGSAAPFASTSVWGRCGARVSSQQKVLPPSVIIPPSESIAEREGYFGTSNPWLRRRFANLCVVRDLRTTCKWRFARPCISSLSVVSPLISRLAWLSFSLRW